MKCISRFCCQQHGLNVYGLEKEGRGKWGEKVKCRAQTLCSQPFFFFQSSCHARSRLTILKLWENRWNAKSRMSSECRNKTSPKTQNTKQTPQERRHPENKVKTMKSSERLVPLHNDERLILKHRHINLFLHFFCMQLDAKLDSDVTMDGLP